MSQLLTFITGIGGLIVPLILWITQKDKVDNMDIHGRSIVNFQISIIIYSILSIPLILVFGLGILTLILICIMAFVFPIINAIKASRNELPNYPLTIKII